MQNSEISQIGKNFIVVGGGAIGKLFAAIFGTTEIFQDSKIKTIVKARSNWQILKTRGISLEFPNNQKESLKCHPPVFEEYNNQGIDPNIPRVVILTCKAFDLNNTLQELKDSKINIEAIISPVNGLEIEEKISQYFPETPIIACAVTLPVEEIDKNTAKISNSKGGFAFAPFNNPNNTLIDFLVNLFNAKNFQAIKCDSFLDMRWSKLLLNITGNATCAVFNLTADELYSNKYASLVELRMFQEYFAVKNALKIKIIDLPGYKAKKSLMLEKLVKFASMIPLFGLRIFMKFMKPIVSKARGDKNPSFVRDKKAGRKIEAEWYNGKIAQFGKEHGIKYNFNFYLTKALMENKSFDPKRFYHLVLKAFV